MNYNLPDLKRFCRHSSVVWLNQSDFVETPVGSSSVSVKFGTIGVGDLVIDRVTVPVFGPGEVPEIIVGELGLVVHDCLSSFEVTPTAGTRDGRSGRRN
jgi:hypothetical protein